MQSTKDMINIPTALWSKDYCENLTFELLRERFFPEFPKSIFYTRTSMVKPASDWVQTFGHFAIREKIFCMEGQVMFRDASSNPKWQLRLVAGEYGEIVEPNYQIKLVAEKNLYYRVIERPAHNQWPEDLVKVGKK